MFRRARWTRYITAVFTLVLFAMGNQAQAAKPIKANGKVKVFILAGQSNMQGKGGPKAIAWQISQTQYRERYKDFVKDQDFEKFTQLYNASIEKNPKQPTFNWAKQPDVFISYNQKHDHLMPGFSDRKNNIGPEMGFGLKMGKRYQDPVLLIKTAWGGKSLGVDFRPPSKMYTDAQFIEMAKQRNTENATRYQQQLERYQKNIAKFAADQAAGKLKKNQRKPRTPRKPQVLSLESLKAQYGKYYRLMMQEVDQAIANRKSNHPNLKDQGYEIVGFVWYQGFNDQFSDECRLNYEENMVSFIKDIRKELNQPNLPVVIGQLGTNGDRQGIYPKDRQGKLNGQGLVRKAQHDAAHRAEFKNSVKLVRTAELEDQDAADIYYSKGSWKKDVKKWERFGSDRPYHYLGSPWFFLKTGYAFGDAMEQLLD